MIEAMKFDAMVAAAHIVSEEDERGYHVTAYTLCIDSNA
jgi:hypothetical protein